MKYQQSWKVGSVSAFIFAVFIIVLTALRVWELEPATPVQSAILNGTALLALAAVAFYVYRGGDFIAGWILVFGPSLAFALNLFIPVSTMGVLLKIGYALVSAGVISGVIAVIGYVTGRSVGRLRKDDGLPRSA